MFNNYNHERNYDFYRVKKTPHMHNALSFWSMLAVNDIL